jgi:hypothetical protein
MKTTRCSNDTGPASPQHCERLGLQSPVAWASPPAGLVSVSLTRTSPFRRNFFRLSASLAVLFITSLLLARNAIADGCFVYHWDKKKDINEPTQKAIIVFDQGVQEMLLQVKYEGPAEEFGWVIPVPAKPEVTKGSMKCFYELSQLTQMRIGLATLSAGDESKSNHKPVQVIETKTVGAYEIAVLSAQDGKSLEAWLSKNGFSVPKDKSGIVEDYVKKGWYFIAVRIGARDLQVRSARKAVGKQLAEGELHPLHIKFPTDQCIFPLKISAVNGKPSEVSLYVISKEPLASPLIYARSVKKGLREVEERNTMQRRQAGYESAGNTRALMMGWAFYQNDAKERPANLSAEDLRAMADRFMGRVPPQKQSVSDYFSEELFTVRRANVRDIPRCAQAFSRLKKGDWFLTKQTWTFEPDQMEDLVFRSTVPMLSESLAHSEGFASAWLLFNSGPDGHAALLHGLENTNPVVRLHACSMLEMIVSDRVKQILPKLFRDSEPEIRARVIQTAGYHYWHPELADKMVEFLHDDDEDVRQAAAAVLIQHRDVTQARAGELIQLLDENNNGVRASALRVLSGLSDVRIPRDKLLRMLSAPRLDVVSQSFHLLRKESPITSDESISLLKNELGMARLMGLKVLSEAADKRAAQLTVTLLRDPEEMIRRRAGNVLKKLTGEQIPFDNVEAWEKLVNSHS